MSLLRRKWSPLAVIGFEPELGPYADAPAQPTSRGRGPGSLLARLFAQPSTTPPEPVRLPPLTLELPDRTIRFEGLAAFEFSLDSRTEFPYGRLAGLAELDAPGLAKLSHHIRQIERRLAEVLARTIDESDRTCELLVNLEHTLFSKDHGWRDIIEALKFAGPGFDGYRRLALVKYMQYLAARQDAIRGVQAQRLLGGDADGPVARQDGGEMPGERPDSLRDTVVLDAPVDIGEGLRALPRGEAVCIRHVAPEGLMLDLAGGRFELLPGEAFALIGPAGERYPLGPGPSLVGRSRECDITVDPSHRCVSRRHLMIEPVSRSSVLLTDLSNHGTRVPAGAI